MQRSCVEHNCFTTKLLFLIVLISRSQFLMLYLYSVGGRYMKTEYRVLAEWSWQGEAEALGEEPFPLPLCQPQIPHGLGTLYRPSMQQ